MCRTYVEDVSMRVQTSGLTLKHTATGGEAHRIFHLIALKRSHFGTTSSKADNTRRSREGSLRRSSLFSSNSLVTPRTPCGGIAACQSTITVVVKRWIGRAKSPDTRQETHPPASRFNACVTEDQKSDFVIEECCLQEPDRFQGV